MSALTSRDRRALRVGLLVLLPALALGLLVRPYLAAVDDARDRLAGERALLARERSLLDAAGAYGLAASAADEGLASRAPRLFRGDPMLAAGELVRYIADAAASSSVLLEATETRGAADAGPGVVAVRVQIRAAGDIEGVLRFLRRVEDGPRLVHVEKLSLERRESYRSDAAEDVQVLALAATLTGFTLAEPAATPEVGE